MLSNNKNSIQAPFEKLILKIKKINKSKKINKRINKKISKRINKNKK
jgi:hypothetical protein